MCKQNNRGKDLKDIKIKIPKNQISWTRYVKNNKTTHIITSTIMRDKYFLNEMKEDGSLIKIATSSQPIFKGFNDD